MTSVSERLEAVIKMLEYGQERAYSAHVNLILSYLYDIRDDRVPEQTMRYISE